MKLHGKIRGWLVKQEHKASSEVGEKGLSSVVRKPARYFRELVGHFGVFSKVPQRTFRFTKENLLHLCVKHSPIVYFNGLNDP